MKLEPNPPLVETAELALSLVAFEEAARRLQLAFKAAYPGFAEEEPPSDLCDFLDDWGAGKPQGEVLYWLSGVAGAKTAYFILGPEAFES